MLGVQFECESSCNFLSTLLFYYKSPQNKSCMPNDVIALCEAKPTTLKRPSPGGGFENHMCHINICGNMECDSHLNEIPTYLEP